MKVFIKDEIVVHKMSPNFKLRIVSEINPSQYEVVDVLTGVTNICMSKYLLSVQEYRAELIKHFLD